jgi:hypothetical protein
VYYFELIIKFYIKSSSKTLKFVNISNGSQKFAWELPDEFFFLRSKIKNNLS